MTDNLFNPNDSYAQSFVKLVREELNDIKRQFFKIGFRLAEANREGYYQELGYENIAECAEDLFGFKKTTTYDLINVYNDFHDRLAPMTIKKEYDKYSQSQLVQLTGNIWARDSFIKYVQPEDTITVQDKNFSFEYGIVTYEHRFSINRSLNDYEETTLNKCIRIGLELKYKTMAKDKLVYELQIVYKDENNKLQCACLDLEEYHVVIKHKGNMMLTL